MYATTSQPLNEQDAVTSLAAHFAALTDNRKPRGVRYQLTPLLVLIVLAKLCGANNPQEMAKWIEYRAAWLREALGLRWARMPHHSTYRRVLQSALNLLELRGGGRPVSFGFVARQLSNAQFGWQVLARDDPERRDRRLTSAGCAADQH